MFHPNLICWSSGEEEDINHVEAIENFLDALEELTKVAGDDQERNVITYFHNMRGFDGTFIQETPYKQGRTIDKSLTQGAKMLAFQCGNLMFRDSMNFFNMALDKFPATFNLQELYKGFFPPMWSHVENFNYRGVYPPADECCPNEMSEKKRATFLAWHAEKVQSGAMLDFQEELLKYCERDVKLWKEGCMKFIEEFQSIAGFNLLV